MGSEECSKIVKMIAGRFNKLFRGEIKQARVEFVKGGDHFTITGNGVVYRSAESYLNDPMGKKQLEACDKIHSET